MPANSDFQTLFGLLVAGALTLMTLSYVVKDNVVFRVVLHLLVGVSAGYAGAMAVQDVIVPQLILPLQNQLAGSPQISFFDLAARTLLSLLLLSKLFPKTASIGNPVTASLVGVGAALAIGGAVQGTLFPQLSAAANSFDTAYLQLAVQGGYYVEGAGLFIQGAITLLATVGTLAYFHFGAQKSGRQATIRGRIVKALAWIGRVFIPIAFATLFSGVMLAALSALIERVSFLVELTSFISGAN